MNPRALGAALALGLLACSAEPNLVVAPTRASAEPAASASSPPPAPPSAGLEPAPVAPPPLPKGADSGFTLTFRQTHADARAELFPLDTKAILVAGTTWESTLLKVDDTGVHADPSLQAGLVGAKGKKGRDAYRVTWVEGQWGKALDLELDVPVGLSFEERAFSWADGAWQPKPRVTRKGTRFRSLASGVYEGKLLYIYEKDMKARLVHIDGLAVVEARPKPAPTKSGPPCKDAILGGYFALAVLPSNELWGIGAACPPVPVGGPVEFILEHWLPGAEESTVTSIGRAPKIVDHAVMAAASPTEVYLGMSLLARVDSLAEKGGPFEPYLLRWDGKKTTDVTPPCEGAIKSLKTEGAFTYAHCASAGSASLWRVRNGTGGSFQRLTPEVASIPWYVLAPDGELWAKVDKELWVRDVQGGWRRIGLPALATGLAAEVQQVAFVDKMALIVASSGTSFGLYQPIAATTPLDLALAGERAKARLSPPTPLCKEPAVMLYQLSRVAAKDYDFPLTRKALKGQTQFTGTRFLESAWEGDRYLVGVTKDLETAKKLQERVQKEVAGSTPQLVCGVPGETTRTLSFNLATGEMQK